MGDKRGLTLVEVLATLVIFTLMLGALFSFSIAVQRGAAKTRILAANGQAVELALTMLRHELAGAIDLEANGDKLSYRRIRDNEIWEMELVEKVLQRRNIAGEIFSYVNNIDEFSFELPDTDNRLVSVTVRSGVFEISDKIYLRNSSDDVFDPHDPGGE